tara:strand:+ start:83 stop:457 length:375 start_codon:yes stop_codon:yes gene_type:complete
MSNASDYLEERILTNEIYSAANSIHLYTVAEADDGMTGSESMDSNYGSQSIYFDSPVSPDGTITTSSDVEFPSFAGDDDDIVGWAIQDGSANLLVHGTFAGGDITIVAGSVVKIMAGDLTINCA